MRSNVLLVSLAIILAAAIGFLLARGPAPSAGPDAARAAMERGIGMLESFRYLEARDALREAVALRPDWVDARVNYAIALMNATSDETTGESLADEAIDLMRGVLEAEPDNPNALFLLGFLLLHSHGEAEEALRYLSRVPEPDAATWFWMGRAELDLRDFEKALGHFEEAIRVDRHCSAAYYGAFSCLTAMGRAQDAKERQEAWERVRPPEQANLIDAKGYHQIGKYVLAIRRFPGSRAPSRTFDWEEVEAGDLTAIAPPDRGPGIGIGDVDGDGDLDLFACGGLFRNDGGLRFTRTSTFPLPSGLFLDFDADQILDLYLHAPDGERLFRGKGDGSFEDVTQAAFADVPRARPGFALASDLDLDGDVDLFVTDGEGADRMLRNDRDGTFTVVRIGAPGPSVSALDFDVDRDLDPDLLVTRAEGPPLVFRNDRADGFVAAGTGPQDPGPFLVAADMDRDGYEEVRTVTHPVLHEDVDLDGLLDEIALPAATSAAAADFDGNGTPEVVVLGRDGRLSLRRARVEPGHWIAFDLRGRKAPAPPQWAAPVGPGSTVEVLAGGTWQMRVQRSLSGTGGQHSPWVTFGLGPDTKVGVVRILWPDRVLQAEMEIPANQIKMIREANRKPSSCPLLFAEGRDGTRFVTDFLGSGGLGFFIERGVYGKPDPDEVVWIGNLEPVDGDFVLKALEPLEEISYLDEMTLLAVDHPADVEVFPNERFAGEEPFPEFRIWEIARRIAPARAWNDRAQEVGEAIASVDRTYAPIELTHRFEGFAKPHWLALDFTGRVPDLAEGERLVLLLDGWVEYGYSHSNAAAAQAGLALEPPCLELCDGDGWRVAIPNTGYPAGLPRTMTLDVTGVVTPANPVFRLRTNLELYCDRVTLGVDRGTGRSRVHRLPPRSADLHERGYPREYSPDGGLPLLYDYGLIDPGYPFRTMTGDYTRFGEVAPLLAGSDDRYVIFGKGEELTLRYPAAALPAPPEGGARTFMVYTVGFCKDMDAYTAHPETVEPLPFLAMPNYPYEAGVACPDDEAHRRYRAEYNTRRVLR